MRRPGSNWVRPLCGRKIIAIVNAPRASNIWFGRMNAPPAERGENEQVATAAMSQDASAPVGSEAEQEDHDRFLAHIRGPEHKARKEEQQVPIPATSHTAECKGEGAVEVDEAYESEPAEDQEGPRLVDSGDGHDHAGDDAHRSVGDNPLEMARSQGEVEVAESVRQQRSLRVIPPVVGDTPVQVVDHPDLNGGAE